jgi:hypothetical protein
MTIHYEWDIEKWVVHGDGEEEILDHHHRDRLAEFGAEELIHAINRDAESADTYTRLVLVRDRYDHRDLACRSWAYVTEDGKMPERFLDAYDRPVATVPKRFIEEFSR